MAKQNPIRFKKFIRREPAEDRINCALGNFDFFGNGFDQFVAVEVSLADEGQYTHFDNAFVKLSIHTLVYTAQYCVVQGTI